MYGIETVDDALTARKISKDTDKGIWVVNEELGRGFDLKMADDAYVFVLDNARKLNLTMIMQMIGRGSRCQGISEGEVYVSGGEPID